METLQDLPKDPKSINCKYRERVQYICPRCNKLITKEKRYIIKHGYNCYECNRLTSRKNIDYKSLINKQKKTLFEHYGVTNPGQIEKNRKISSETAKKTVKRTGGIAKYFKEHKEECLEKRKQTYLAHFGVDNPSKNYDIRCKQSKKYIYDNISFDSSWEVAFYIFHRDLNHKIVREPMYFVYFDEKGKKHKYFPDFDVDGLIYELKGDNFMKELIGTPKLNCMINNNVIIYNYEQMKPILYYVSSNYGKDFLKNCKKFN